MTLSDEEISRSLSHALRHNPDALGITLDTQGWVDLSAIADALRQQGGEWSHLLPTDLEGVVTRSTKARHEISDGRIRACYGHSLPEVISHVPTNPPALLYHGTGRQQWELIRVQGLRPMKRQYVHLAPDVPTARAVGLRKDRNPVILQIDTTKALEEGSVFFASKEVWLAAPISPNAISELQSI